MLPIFLDGLATVMYCFVGVGYFPFVIVSTDLLHDVFCNALNVFLLRCLSICYQQTVLSNVFVIISLLCICFCLGFFFCVDLDLYRWYYNNIYLRKLVTACVFMLLNHRCPLLALDKCESPVAWLLLLIKILKDVTSYFISSHTDKYCGR
ncbi:hypothetical protein, unlikely [Trypanosoma brucei gambiense DAL972]|uniref:Uncharacterized protein n=1 Tax=Trypanosoma brucei gambiense (strain MHOM/CI/86/DAL972) TaxID=679716 RepID=C9ZKF6_TRYB9|nr:hypothetical protein, unlikely [Trypanosoma brucei gambiense DAL972]CBH09922.1 hypothetical protein, unlikely [Trypanosoma brucei gambiense DAL972]|eukprot:XP_011772213.1 hypothetical protein, unlikely [Trypanosoma brucei gambiense DAL972]